MRKHTKFVAIAISFLISTAMTSGTAFAAPTVAPTLISPDINGLVVSNVALNYSLPETPSPNSVTVTLSRTSPATPSFTRTIVMSNDMTMNLSIDIFAAPNTILGQNPTKITAINPPSEILPVGVYTVSLSYQNSTGGQAATVSKSLVTFTFPCSVGTYSTDGNVPVGSDCTQAPANSYVAAPGATSATSCPSGYTSPAGSDASSDCIAPVVSETPATVNAPAAKALPTLAKGKKMKIKTLATQIEMSIPAKSKVTAKVAKSSKKICKVSGTSIKALKPGACVVTVKVKPKKGSATTKATTITVN